MDFISESNLSQKNGVAGIVGTKDWLKFMCLGFLNFIPVVGSLIYLGVLIYLVVSNTTAESVKSYIKAIFIVTGISLALAVVLYALLFGYLVSVLG